MIPIDRITVVNPRVRNKKVFKGIVENIAEIGLKRPITVTSRHGEDGPLYDLVCGQGRLEAFRQLGQTEVPALRSEEHTSELQSLMRISYAVFCLKKKKTNHPNSNIS